jgi:hypothetical protein
LNNKHEQQANTKSSSHNTNDKQHHTRFKTTRQVANSLYNNTLTVFLLFFFLCLELPHLVHDVEVNGLADVVLANALHQLGATLRVFRRLASVEILKVDAANRIAHPHFDL